MPSGEIYEYGLQEKHIEKISGVNNTWMLSKISNRYDNPVLFNYDIFDDNQPRIKSITYAKGLNKILFKYSDRKDVTYERSKVKYSLKRG